MPSLNVLLPPIMLAAGVGLFVLLIVKGFLSPRALDEGPSRKVGLLPFDLLIALGLMMVVPNLVAILVGQFSEGQTEAGDPQQIDTLSYAGRALLAQASGQLVPVLYLIWRSSFAENGWRKIGVIPTKPLRDVRWGALGFFAVVPIVMAAIQITVLIGQFFGQQPPVLAHNMLKMLVDSDSLLGTVLIVFSAVIVAPILEEGVFRGIFQSVMVETLGESRRWTVVIVASLLFTFMHVNFETWENWQALPGLLVLGISLGWLYERSGSLLPSILVHMGFNALNIIMALAYNKAQTG